MTRLHVWAAAMSLVLGSCGESHTEAEQPALSECVVGVWVRSSQACSCDMGETPECGQTSCREYRTAWALRADGASYEFALRFTAEAPRTLSAAGELLPGEWELTGTGELDRVHGGLSSVGPVTCDGEMLTWRGIAFERADPDMSGAMMPFIATGERWTGVAY